MKMTLKPEVINKLKSAANPTELSRYLEITRPTVYNLLEGSWNPDSLRILTEITALVFGTLDVRLTDLLDPEDTCRHTPDLILFWESGGSHFSGGDYYDNVKPHWICKGCGRDFDRDPNAAPLSDNPDIEIP